MKTIFYNRSDIYNFLDLPQKLQKKAFEKFCCCVSHYESGNCSECGKEIFSNIEYEQFVTIKRGNELEVLPLNMFVKTNSKYIHGFYSLSAFSGYCITLSNCGTTAIVSYRVS